jgi:glycosyltransferase involved in cell wall biosynthesis
MNQEGNANIQRDNIAPTVSIGMPVYNGEKYVREALDSLLAQTFTDFELIISDNASTDRTEPICREYAAQDARIRFVRQKRNEGAIANFNFVLDQAVGRYFMWAAADDVWDRRWIEVLLDDHAPDVAIAFGHVVNVDAESKVTRVVPYRPYTVGKTVRLLQYFFRQETDGKANLIYGIYRTAELKRRRFRVYGRCGICPSSSDMVFVFDHAQDGRLSTNASVVLGKRLIIDGARPAGSLAKRLRHLLLFDLIPHFFQYAAVARNPLLKILLVSFMPIKYVKTFLVEWFRLATRIMAVSAKKMKHTSAVRERV